MKIEVVENVLKYNKDQADKNRNLFKSNNILVLNLLSSPGAGKTSLIIETIKRLNGKKDIGVIEGDISSTYDAEKIKKFTDYLNSLIDLFTDYRMILILEPSLCIFLQNFIFFTRHNLVNLGDNNNYKLIFLCLYISWPQYEKELWKFFTESFTGIKFKKPEMEKNKLRETVIGIGDTHQTGNSKSIKKQFINYLCDMNVIFLIEKSQNNKALVKILNSVFLGHTQREEILLYLIKWYV